MDHSDQTVEQQIGAGIFGLALIFCSLQLVPDWKGINLGWSRISYFLIMTAAGGIAGALVGKRYRLAGLIGGLVGGATCMFPVILYLENMDWVHSFILIILGLVGALPGFFVYAFVSGIQESQQSNRPRKRRRKKRRIIED